jgi:hypothetical protein
MSPLIRGEEVQPIASLTVQVLAHGTVFDIVPHS